MGIHSYCSWNQSLRHARLFINRNQFHTKGMDHIIYLLFIFFWRIGTGRIKQIAVISDHGIGFIDQLSLNIGTFLNFLG